LRLRLMSDKQFETSHDTPKHIGHTLRLRLRFDFVSL
jgi:hypothetical protein